MSKKKKTQNEQGKLEYSVLVKDPSFTGEDTCAEVLERNEGDLHWTSLCACSLERAEEIATALQWQADSIWEYNREETDAKR
jgi:hypothetical protein